MHSRVTKRAAPFRRGILQHNWPDIHGRNSVCQSLRCIVLCRPTAGSNSLGAYVQFLCMHVGDAYMYRLYLFFIWCEFMHLYTASLFNNFCSCAHNVRSISCMAMGIQENESWCCSIFFISFHFPLAPCCWYQVRPHWSIGDLLIANPPHIDCHIKFNLMFTDICLVVCKGRRVLYRRMMYT